MGVFSLLGVLLGLAQAGSADPSNVRGVVRDQTGAVLQGASVELLAGSADTLRSVVTNGNGEYVIDHVPAGTYTLKVQFAGFRPAEVRVRVVSRKVTTPQTIILELASQSQEVT